MKTRGGSGIVEKNKNRIGVEKSKTWRHVEYSTVGYKVVVAFIFIFGMCKKKSVQSEDVICANDNSWYI